ncbi:MAG: 5-(carboxyamino)imidazole ribonucleotide synthase [Flavobacteriales bacterium]
MKNFYASDFKLGILGGGQLGRMLIQDAINLDVHISVLDPSDNCPCAEIASSFTLGSFNDYDAVYEFGQSVDLLTIEIENVNTEALFALQREGKTIYPKPENLVTIKDKGLQKQFYKDHGIASSAFKLIEGKEQITEFPIVQKLRTGGYDGRGVQVLRTEADLAKAFTEPSVLEDLVDIEKELSVIISRTPSGQVKTFPLVELEFNPEANLVEFLFAPAQVSAEVEKRCFELANRVVEAFDFVGLLAVELFLSKTGEVLVNEVAPRTHNSGHHTIESCHTSQFEQHMRAVLDLPLGDTELRSAAVMLNLLGDAGFTGPVKYEGIEKVLALPGVGIHIYGKADTKPFRKMGHVTVTHPELAEAKHMATQILKELKVKA